MLLGLIFPGLEWGIFINQKISAVVKNSFYYKCFTAVIFGANIQHFQEFLLFDIILVSKSVCDFLWLKVFSNSVYILSWNQPRIQGIFLFWYQMVAKVCHLYLELIRHQRGKVPLGWDCHQAYEVYTKLTLFTKYVSLYIKNFICALIWTNLPIPVDLPPLTK